MPPPKREPPARSAKSYAMWLLSRRDYSAKELLKKLTVRGYPQEEAQLAVTSMQGYGFQDDVRYAESKARSVSRKLGNRRVTAALTEKGLDKELVAQQLESLEPEENRAMRVAERFHGKTLDDATKSKVWRFLAYRGFSGSIIKSVLEDLARRLRAEEVEETT